jgi:hypothetical protein
MRLPAAPAPVENMFTLQYVKIFEKRPNHLNSELISFENMQSRSPIFLCHLKATKEICVRFYIHISTQSRSMSQLI